MSLPCQRITPLTLGLADLVRPGAALGAGAVMLAQNCAGDAEVAMPGKSQPATASNAVIDCRNPGMTVLRRAVAIGLAAWSFLAFVAATDARAEEKGFMCHPAMVCFNNGEPCILDSARIFFGGQESKIFFNEGLTTVFAIRQHWGSAVIASIHPDGRAEITEHRQIDSGDVLVMTYQNAVCSEWE